MLSYECASKKVAKVLENGNFLALIIITENPRKHTKIEHAVCIILKYYMVIQIGNLIKRSLTFKTYIGTFVFICYILFSVAFHPFTVLNTTSRAFSDCGIYIEINVKYY